MGLGPRLTDQRTQYWAVFPQLPVAKASCSFPTPSSSHFSMSLAHAPVCQMMTLSKALLRAIRCRNLKAILSIRLLHLLLTADACSHPFAAADIKVRWLGMSKGRDAFFHSPLPLQQPPCSFLNQGLPAKHSAVG